MDELDRIKKHFKESNTRNEQFGQSVPENYFEELEDKILLGLTQKENEVKSTIKKKTLYTRIVKFSAVAAAVTILFLGVNYFNEAPEDTFAELIEGDIETEYFLENEDLFTEDFLELEGIDEVLDELEQQLNN
jgi:hypothetical protein